MLTLLLSMLAFALVGAITPGPVNLIATGSGASYGFLRTLPHVLGATVAYTLIVLLGGLGLGEVLLNLPQLTQLLELSSAAFLLYLAWRIASAPPTDYSRAGAELVDSGAADNTRQPPGWSVGALVQLLNPKAWLVSLSGVALFVTGPADNEGTQRFYLLLFTAVSFAMCFLGVGCWAALGHLLRRHLSQPRKQRLFNSTMGLLLCAAVVTLVMDGR